MPRFRQGDSSTTREHGGLGLGLAIVRHLIELHCSALQSRPPRLPNHEAEREAWAALAREMAESPRNMLQKLAETAVELCQADSAGISLLEGGVFRWEALAGVFAAFRSGTMPRDASPCGICIDRNAPQLMYLPDRCFPALLTEPRFVETLLIPFHFQGKPIGTVWAVSHNYERKFDREDERALRTLAQFASAGWQLWKACEAASESSRNKDKFVAMLGHELRNPLAAILNANDVVQKLGINDSGIEQPAGVVARQAQHLCRIVDDLIDLARINLGKLDLHRERVELRTIVAQAVETTRAQIEHRRHKLSVRIPAETIRIDGDPARLAQLLSNLLDNAAKYTPNGGLISVVAEVVHDKVCIRVRDTGIGIPSDRISSIFGLYTQLQTPATTASTGLGLGLTLVRTLVDLHGGSVEVVSNGSGKGSQFTIRLPILPLSAPNDQPKEANKQSVMPTRRRILLVEDNEDVAESLGQLLAMDGHIVNVAQNGEVALGKLRTFEPEVVLLDIGLPGMDGYHVARRMREATGRKDLVIVALSGYGQDEHRRQAREAGCDEHFVKPVNPTFCEASSVALGIHNPAV
jgi:signal transduction histidine kinase/CheY-like chemotaxis protein